MINIAKVVVRPSNKTTISSPNFTPRLNVSIESIQGANVSVRQDGDTLIYDATRGEYVSKPIDAAELEITNIDGGKF